MRIARIATLAIALCAASASIASAQRPDSTMQGGRRGMGPNLLEGITLTDAQQAQVKAIRDAETADIRAVLTADQQKVLDKNVVSMRERMANRPPRN
jgi:Spy/CpxP family protein refolding chaperone